MSTLTSAAETAKHAKIAFLMLPGLGVKSDITAAAAAALALPKTSCARSWTPSARWAACH
ncbi:hypothetical protein ACQUSY_10185 [Microbacterium sp. YY-03]|uniref:hypothetical protein n=1 Tax=Microbacterium sp. YY-03 TaxID=3421636 RepID=UPI003D16CDDF